jgi:hypothetical protein
MEPGGKLVLWVEEETEPTMTLASGYIPQDSYYDRCLEYLTNPGIELELP